MRFIKIGLIKFRWKNNIVKAQEGGWTFFNKIVIVIEVLNNKYEQKKTNNNE